MRSIHGRFILMLLIGLVFVLPVGGVLVYLIARANLTRQFDAGLETRVRALSSLVSIDEGQIEFEVSESRDQTQVERYFEFKTRSGESLRRSFALGAQVLPSHDLDDGQLLIEDVIMPDGAPGRAAWLAFQPRYEEEILRLLEDEPDRIIRLTVVAAAERTSIDGALAAILGALVLAGGGMGATLALLATIGVRWGLVPIKRLTRQIEQVDVGTRSTGFDDQSVPRELEPVYAELNRMLDRVQATLDRERSFADGAAHELRTPLAELRTTAEVALRWPDAEGVESSLREILEIGTEMESLVESLMMISRGHSARLSEERQDVNVRAIVEEILTGRQAMAAEKRLRISVDIDEQSSLHVVRSAIEIILQNLIENAVHHTPIDGVVAIRTERLMESEDVVLIVENGPVELTSADLPHLFVPFWQRDSARSERERAGLGLSVVRQVSMVVGLAVSAELEGDVLSMRVSPSDEV